jgi:hypothetical protein
VAAEKLGCAFVSDRHGHLARGMFPRRRASRRRRADEQLVHAGQQARHAIEQLMLISTSS